MKYVKSKFKMKIKKFIKKLKQSSYKLNKIIKIRHEKLNHNIYIKI